MAFSNDYKADYRGNDKEAISKVMLQLCYESQRVFENYASEAIEGQILSNYKYILAHRVEATIGEQTYLYYQFSPVIYRNSFKDSSTISVTNIIDGKTESLPISNWKKHWYLLYFDENLDLFKKD